MWLAWAGRRCHFPADRASTAPFGRRRSQFHGTAVVAPREHRRRRAERKKSGAAPTGAERSGAEEQKRGWTTPGHVTLRRRELMAPAAGKSVGDGW